MFNLEKTLLAARTETETGGTQLNLSRDQLKTYTDMVVKQITDILNARFMGDHTREDQEVLRCIAEIEDHFVTDQKKAV